MPYVIVHATELSRLEPNAPSAQQIDAAFASVNLGGGNWGAWVGPRARVTRQAIIGSGFQTDAAYLYGWPDNDFVTQHLDYMRQQLLAQVQQALSASSSDWTVNLEAFAPAVNGDVSWWQSGQASITQTRTTFPTGGGRTDAAENPTGPTTPLTHPSTVGDIFHGLGTGAMSVLIPAAVIAVAFAATKFAPSRSGEQSSGRRLAHAE